VKSDQWEQDLSRVARHLKSLGFEILGPRTEYGYQFDLVARRHEFGRDDLVYVIFKSPSLPLSKTHALEPAALSKFFEDGRILIVSRSGFTRSAIELLARSPRVFFLNLSEITGEQPMTISRKAFLVHGHDEAAKQSVARTLEQIGLEPIILHEQVSRSRTIIEKIEAQRDVGYAVVLLTPDDIGASSTTPDVMHARPRQNVLFELGYFMGYLGRDRVCVLKKGELEVLSDYDGVVYVPMDAPGVDWRLKMAREIEDVGIEVDLRKLR
jgi:predicted nucleotide-binding protein